MMGLRMRSMLFVAFLSAAAAVQAGAPSVVPPTADKPAATVPDGDKMICRREQVIGSNILGKRVCKLRSVIVAEQAAARQAAQDMTTPQGSGSSSN